MTFHDGDMNRDEIYGTLMREATDDLESAVNKQLLDERFTLLLAEDLLADVVAARIRQQQTTRE